MRAQPAHIRHLTFERPLAPLAGAAPVRDGLVAHLAVITALGDHHVIGAVIALHRGIYAVERQVLDIDRALAAQTQSLGPNVAPGGGADALVGLDQRHPLASLMIESGRDIDIPEALDLAYRVVAETLDRIVEVVDVGLDLDVLARQTGLTGGQTAARLLCLVPVVAGSVFGGIPPLVSRLEGELCLYVILRKNLVRLPEVFAPVGCGIPIPVMASGAVRVMRILRPGRVVFLAVLGWIRPVLTLVVPVVIVRKLAVFPRRLGEQIRIGTGLLALTARLARQRLGGAQTLVGINIVVGGDGRLVVEIFHRILRVEIVGQVGGVVLIDRTLRLGRESVRSHPLDLGVIQPDLEPVTRNLVLGAATADACLNDPTAAERCVDLIHC